MTSTDTTKCTHALGLVRCSADVMPGTTSCVQCATPSELDAARRHAADVGLFESIARFTAQDREALDILATKSGRADVRTAARGRLAELGFPQLLDDRPHRRPFV